MRLVNSGRGELMVGSQGEMGIGSSSIIHGQLNTETLDVRAFLRVSGSTSWMGLGAEASEL